MVHWLVQGNPAKWRVHEFFAGGNQLDSWSITRYRDQVQEGDDVALWLAGRDAGVVALGVVTGAVEDVRGQVLMSSATPTLLAPAGGCGCGADAHAAASERVLPGRPHHP